ncbi:MAG TPA: hypothetical protein VJX68_04185 [Candidatus Binatus sp.]|uniref:hypothetical protein n=1 Tax=Candidatus Binatus sp. TaxID=2811406 RepID=UPI002B4A7DF1|nr:hypothetical protein [Candidatus Binatus sp.]HKN12375.1 hypothetical protein [Candidatus Binatus sp.]
MKQTISKIAMFAIALSAIMFIATRTDAQMRPMMIPLTTTLVITKPAPGTIFGNQQVVTMGVDGKTYKFVLNDAYVDDPRGIIHWPDIWELVRQYKPNFNVTGIGEDTFAKMQPGETLTVRGMFSGNNQTYEVMGTQPGGGNFAPAEHY